jgi:hypothetical protein
MSPRFTRSVDDKRRASVRFIEARSPKLNRRLRLYGRHAFELWLLLECDPSVTALCERPILVDDPSRVIDFWVQSNECEQFLQIGDDAPAAQSIPNFPTICLRNVPLAELAAHRQWLANCERMLPYINGCHGVDLSGLEVSIVRFLNEPSQLSRIEREFAMGDPSVVRAALFSALLDGRVHSAELRTHPLSTLTSFSAKKSIDESPAR